MVLVLVEPIKVMHRRSCGQHKVPNLADEDSEIRQEARQQTARHDLYITFGVGGALRRDLLADRGHRAARERPEVPVDLMSDLMRWLDMAVS
jgi:hypothetical protein